MVMNVSKIAIVDGLGDPSFLGIMSSISISIVLLFDILLSYLSDTKSRRYVAMTAALCWAAYAATFLHITPLIMIFAAIVHGFGSALQNGVPGAIAMDMIPQKTERLKWLARMDIFMLVGVLAGNGIGIYIYSIYPDALFVLAAVLLFLSAISSPFLIKKNSSPKSHRTEAHNIQKTFRQVFLEKNSRLMFGASIAARVIFMTIQTYWIVFFAVEWDLAETATFLPLFLVTTGVIFSQVVANGIISLLPVSKISPFVTLPALLVLGVALLFPSDPIVFSTLIFISFLVGKLSIHVSFVYFQNEIESEYRGTFSSLVSTISSLVAICLILVAGPFIDTHFILIILFLVGSSIIMYFVLSHLNRFQVVRPLQNENQR